MNKTPDNLRSKAHAGFGLVDLMVGMVIALLGIIIIFQVFSVSEGIKRTTTSGGDALQNGASSMFALERSLKAAGYGIFSSTNVNLLPPLPADPAGTAAVTIFANGTSSAPSCSVASATYGSDCIVLRYRPSSGANSWDFGSFPPASGAGFMSPPPLYIETITVKQDCMGAGTSSLLQLCSSVLNPSTNTTTNTVIADGIVLMKAEYGFDLNGNGVIDSNEWFQALPNANVLSVFAVRVVLVARSAQPEVTRNAAGAITACATTTAPPAWIDSVNVPLDLTSQADLVAAADDWKCYRYKKFENTVPLRNVMWRPL
jgi:type IV pilus assembly protein PilW